MSSSSRRELLGAGLGALVLALCRRSGAHDAEGTPAGPNLNDLVERTYGFLAALNVRELDGFLSLWPRARERRTVTPASVPVVRWLSRVEAKAPNQTTALVGELVRRAALLNWRRTYREPVVSAQFLNNYGYTELAGLAGPVPSQRLACGFLLLGPDTIYPRHRHEAEEIYVPLSGAAAWLHGDQPWRIEQPGTVIHHASNEPHAMRTSDEPLLALYLWRSDNLDQKSRID